MHIRLTPNLGGDGTKLGIIALNDSGSDVLTIFDEDLLRLGENVQSYNSWYGVTDIRNANGIVDECRMILVQVQLVRDDYTSWTDWIDEVAIVKPIQPGLVRLSGFGIRKQLYFGTGPGYHSVAVGTTKGGIMSLL